MNRYVIVPNDELYHHGIKGQKWGVRNYQNSDGSLTPEGRLRYGHKNNKQFKGDVKKLSKTVDQYIDADKKYRRALSNSDYKNELAKAESDHNETAKNFIDKYGHKSFQKTLGDKANLYYTNMWDIGLDDLIDYSWKNRRYAEVLEF